MFADMKSMVMKAWHEHYALLAINCMNLESAHAAIRVAEKNRAPIILNLYQGIWRIFQHPSRRQWLKRSRNLPQYRSLWRLIMAKIRTVFVRRFVLVSAD
ncbi:fructose-bisphosphate aldolase class-II [Escherichia coli]|nr:fructose-bisphosphate aldolase class-II [Escherichia coli]